MSEARSPGPTRLGLYGGSFDPIHLGHVLPVLAAREALDLDRVLYLPTAQPPHKSSRDLAPALRRLAMVELALLDHPGLEVSGFEMESEGPAYTVRTLEHFRQLYPEARLFLVLGADSFVQLPTWRRFPDLLELAELAVMARPGWQPDSGMEGADRLDPRLRRALDEGRVHVLTNPPLPMSSTALRRCLAQGEAPPEGWLAPPVLNYIRKYGLYARPRSQSRPRPEQPPSTRDR